MWPWIRNLISLWTSQSVSWSIQSANISTSEHIFVLNRHRIQPRFSQYECRYVKMRFHFNFSYSSHENTTPSRPHHHKGSSVFTFGSLLSRSSHTLDLARFHAKCVSTFMLFLPAWESTLLIVELWTSNCHQLNSKIIFERKLRPIRWQIRTSSPNGVKWMVVKRLLWHR